MACAGGAGVWNRALRLVGDNVHMAPDVVGDVRQKVPFDPPDGLPGPQGFFAVNAGLVATVTRALAAVDVAIEGGPVRGKAKRVAIEKDFHSCENEYRRRACPLLPQPLTSGGCMCIHRM